MQAFAQYDERGLAGSGEWYGIPNIGEYVMFYYNKELFAQVGIAAEPTTTKPENVLLSVRAPDTDGDGQPDANSSACEVYWGQTPVDSRELLDRGQKKLEQLLEDIGGPQNITEENFPEVHIRGDINTPYQCIGGVIYTMQYAGFQKIGFISEPAPGSGTLGRL